MAHIKSILIILVKLYFKVYFTLFGKPELDDNLKKTIALYKGHNFNELFSLVRVWDAPFKVINNLVPTEGFVVDLGSGDGILANYLAISSDKRKLTGIEINTHRLSEANKGIKNVKFRKGDIVKGDYPRGDCILLVHVLHHLPTKEIQEKVLATTVRKLKRGGKLIIVEIVEKPLWKLFFTWLTDAFIVPVLFEGRLFDFNFHYRKQKDWVKILKNLGLKVKISNPHKGKPFSHVVYFCRSDGDG